MNTTQHKTCTKCGEEKSCSHFSKDKYSRDGLQRRCKQCQSNYYREKKNLIKSRGESAYKLGIKEKKCTKCGQVKPPDSFHKDKYHPTGRDSHCKECKRVNYEKNGDRLREKSRNKWSEMSSEKRAKRNEQARERYRENPERFRLYSRKYYRENAESINAAIRQDRRENSDKYLDYQRQWREKNRERRNAQERDRRQKYPERYREILRNYRANHIEILRAMDKEYAREKRAMSNDFVTIPPGTPWTQSEDEFLLQDDGKTVYQKSIELGRTYTSCQWRHSLVRKQTLEACN